MNGRFCGIPAVRYSSGKGKSWPTTDEGTDSKISVHERNRSGIVLFGLNYLVGVKT